MAEIWIRKGPAGHSNDLGLFLGWESAEGFQMSDDSKFIGTRVETETN